MLNFSSREFNQGKETEAIEFYGRSAEETARSQAYKGVSSLEVVQSLCLLALKDIMGKLILTCSIRHAQLIHTITACKPDQAWMTIGTASRLEAMRSLSRDDSRFYDRDLTQDDIGAFLFWRRASVRII